MSIATLTPPKNWKVLDSASLARFINQNLDGERQDTIIAAAQPNAGGNEVFAILEHKKIGYIQSPSQSQIRLAYVTDRMKEDLEILNNESELQGAERVVWQGFSPQPSFDAATHTLRYGVTLSFGGEQALNLYQVVLTKDGFVVLTIVGKPNRNLSLNDWKIAIAPEYQYQKFNASKDRKAQGNLENALLVNAFI